MGWSEDLERIDVQESELVLPRFDTETAWELGVHLRSMAEARKLAVVIDVRRFGQPLFYTALEGTTPGNVEWVRRKINVVQRYHTSSYAVGLREKIENETIYDTEGLSMADYATHGGAFPLNVVHAGVVGCATVSGLPQRSDHELVVEALCELLGKDYPSLQLADEE